MVSSKGMSDLTHSGVEEEKAALSLGWILEEDLLSPPTAPPLIIPWTAQQPSILFLPGLLPQLPQPSFPLLQLL